MGFVVFIIGLTLLVLVVFNATKSIAAANWPVVDGELLFVEFDSVDDDHGFCKEPTLSYTYQVGANICTSSRFGFSFMSRLTSFENADEIETIVMREPLQVYYHPRKPALSVLQTGIRMVHVIHGLISVAIIVIAQVVLV